MNEAEHIQVEQSVERRAARLVQIDQYIADEDRVISERKKVIVSGDKIIKDAQHRKDEFKEEREALMGGGLIQKIMALEV